MLLTGFSVAARQLCTMTVSRETTRLKTPATIVIQGERVMR